MFSTVDGRCFERDRFTVSRLAGFWRPLPASLFAVYARRGGSPRIVHRNLDGPTGHAGRPSVIVAPWALSQARQMQSDPESFTLAEAFERGWHVTGHCARCSEPRSPDLGEVVRRAGTRTLARLWASQALKCGECRSPLASLTIYGQPRSVGPRPVMLRLGVSDGTDTVSQTPPPICATPTA
jgi:hypothetical protein